MRAEDEIRKELAWEQKEEKLARDYASQLTSERGWCDMTQAWDRQAEYHHTQVRVLRWVLGELDAGTK